MENTWDKAKSFLKTEINEQVFTVWFAPIQLSGMDDGSITLTVPNQFFQNWIQEKYISLIKSAVFQASGKELEVRFEIKKQDIPDAPEAEKEEKQDSPDKPSTMGWLKTVFSGTKQMPESRYQEIGLNPKYNFENFVVGPGNRFAHAAALAVCENPARSYNPLFIHGGVGLGKTHILQSIGYQVLLKYPRAKIFYISSEEFTNQLINAIRTKTTAKFREIYRNADILLIDDIQFLAGKESTQEEFFHTFNALYDAHKQIVLSSDRSPKDIPNLEERLVSRFAWGLTADIQPPDFETRTAILAKKSENESVPVPDEVLSFLAEKINTNIRELEGALIRVVAYAKLTACDLSVDLAREVLKGMIEEEVRTTTIPGIQAVVSDYFGLTIDALKSKKRSQAIAHPRQIAMYLSRELTRYSFPDIGGYFGGKDHTTVMHAYNKISNEIKQDAVLKTTIERLVNRLQNK